MPDALLLPPPIHAIPMFRHDSTASAESTLESPLLTPTDERDMSLDSLGDRFASLDLSDGVAISGAPNRTPRRLSLTRQFSKALDDANKSTSPNGMSFKPKSNVLEPILLGSPLRSREARNVQMPPSQSNAFDEPCEPLNEGKETLPTRIIEFQVQSSRRYNDENQQPDLQSVGESSCIAVATDGALKTPVVRVPPRNDVFFSVPGPTVVTPDGHPTDEIEFTPRAHSTLRLRRGFHEIDDDVTKVETEFNDLETKLPEDHPIDIIASAATASGDALEIENPEAINENDADVQEELIEESIFAQLSPLFPLQAAFFPLWCVCVGAAILLAPEHLTAIAFPSSVRSTADSSVIKSVQSLCTALFPYAAPSTRIRALAHWASVAHLHVWIFLTALAAIGFLYPPAGTLLAALSTAQFWQAWGDFKVDDDCAELGADMRQMLYQILLTPESGFRDGDVLKRQGGHYVRERAPKVETRAEILAAGGLNEEYESEDEM
ncbi:unnamed protein product [Mycena citricolor]|uniref:Uncharacterized protein n=1 Tax=Mycena citricolor TaxID=2018698 RepID=A0AAD2JVU3_9AGAR|nr:unnamed protein product [Mycena citricolor]